MKRNDRVVVRSGARMIVDAGRGDAFPEYRRATTAFGARFVRQKGNLCHLSECGMYYTVKRSDIIETQK